MARQQTPELDRALQAGADRKATDVFLIPGEPVSFRVNNEVVRGEGDALTVDAVRTIAEAAVGKHQLEPRLAEGGTAVTSCGLAGVIDGQLTVARSRGQLTVVIGLITYKAISVEAARVPVAMVRAAESSHGLVIFSGRTGSGKTTTLFSVADHLNATHPRHIATVEDPLSTAFTPKRSLVTQREVGVDVPDTLAGIAAALRQDADVILVGELRTPEEVQACVTAATVGRLVLTQMHEPRPERAVQRLCELHPPEQQAGFRRQFAEVLRGVSSQVLFPRADRPGRIPAYGVLIPDEAMRAEIAERGSVQRRRDTPPAAWQELEDDARALHRDGLITEEALRHGLQSLH